MVHINENWIIRNLFLLHVTLLGTKWGQNLAVLGVKSRAPYILQQALYNSVVLHTHTHTPLLTFNFIYFGCTCSLVGTRGRQWVSRDFLCYSPLTIRRQHLTEPDACWCGQKSLSIDSLSHCQSPSYILRHDHSLNLKCNSSAGLTGHRPPAIFLSAASSNLIVSNMWVRGQLLGVHPAFWGLKSGHQTW